MHSAVPTALATQATIPFPHPPPTPTHSPVGAAFLVPHVFVLLQTTFLCKFALLSSFVSFFLWLARVLLLTRERGWKSACGLFHRQKISLAHTADTHMRGTSMHIVQVRALPCTGEEY